MNLSAIDTFLAIVETGSLVAASKKLNVTQSTITARLKALEDSLGQQLFIRYKAGAELTAAGLKFRRYADVMAGLWQQARQDTALPQDVSGICNFGCSAELWPYWGINFFQKIRDLKPDMALSAWPSNHEELQRWLASGVIDIALGERAISAPGCRSEKFFDEDLVLYSTSKNSPIRFDPGYVYVDLGEDFGRAHAMSYVDADIARVSFGNANWALDYILARDGSAYLPLQLALPYVEGGRLFELYEAPRFTRSIYLLANENTYESWSWLPKLLNSVKLCS